MWMTYLTTLMDIYFWVWVLGQRKTHGQAPIIGNIKKFKKVWYRRQLEIVMTSCICILEFSVLINSDQFLGSKSKVPCTSEDELIQKTRQPRTKREVKVDLEFTSFLEKKIPDIFSPPKNPKSLLVSENISPCVTKLPEDWHYEPENLVNLFLLPHVKVFSLTYRK